MNEFDFVKNLPTKYVPKMGRVCIHLEYFVDLNNDAMVQDAKECIYEDVMSLVKCDEIFDSIGVEEAPEATEKDIPSFLTESREE